MLSFVYMLAVLAPRRGTEEPFGSEEAAIASHQMLLSIQHDLHLLPLLQVHADGGHVPRRGLHLATRSRSPVAAHHVATGV